MLDKLSLPVGKKIREFTVVKKLGIGGFGITYLVENSDGHKFVIKELFIRTEYACDRDIDGRVIVRDELIDMFRFALERFIDEAKVLQKLNHAAIVKVYDYFFENSTAYYLMEYLDGESLEDYVKEKGGLSKEDAIKTFFPIMEAVKEMHKFGLWHRDIKPANIMVCRGRSVLIDFGTVKVTDAKIFSINQDVSMFAAFSETFAAPEQLVDLNLTVDQRTDIYSLGCTLFYILTSKPICRGARVRFNGGKNFIKDQLKKYDFEYVFKDTIEKSMAIEKDNRPQSIDEMQKMLIEDTVSKPNPGYINTEIPNLPNSFWSNNWYYVVPLSIVFIIAIVLYANKNIGAGILFSLIFIGSIIGIIVKKNSKKHKSKKIIFTNVAPYGHSIEKELSIGEKYTLGRDTACDIVIPPEYHYVSREHLIIDCTSPDIRVYEVKNTQGTAIDSKRLEVGIEYNWNEGQTLLVVEPNCSYIWKYI